MAKTTENYELMFIIDNDKTEEEKAALVAKFKDLIEANGTVKEIEEWGTRKLAYPINDKPEGYYVLVNFTGAPTLPSELERIFGITEGILRSIVIRHEEKKSAKAEA